MRRLRIDWSADDVIEILRRVNSGEMTVVRAAQQLGTKSGYVASRSKWLDENGTSLEPEDRREKRKNGRDSVIGKDGRVYGVRKAGEGMTFAGEDGDLVRWEAPTVSQRASAAWCLSCGAEGINRHARNCPECGSGRIVKYWHGDGPREQEAPKTGFRLIDRMRIVVE